MATTLKRGHQLIKLFEPAFKRAGIWQRFKEGQATGSEQIAQELMQHDVYRQFRNVLQYINQ
ncbi:hypothetical protein NT239_15135 [Chitinibacter sp. SCUT-21]|uniref:hypothetical protein n=1 Tax=Chitinibacter sp. SCUT-21 TaxID=2970891 RepID=UPI0035A6AEF1